MSNQETNTRKTIITILRTEGPMSAGDLAERIGITEMAIRRHIATLERDNLIYPTTIRQPMGRPAKVYQLTEEADDLFPKNYHSLMLDILEDIVRVDGEDKIKAIFDQREDRLSAQLDEMLAGKSLEEKVQTLAEMQNSKGYLAKWERKTDGSYEIVEYNCPIAQVSKVYPETCACETNVFRRVLGTDVNRSQCLAEGGSCCVFKIHQIEEPQA
ncbi:putative ArsR family transcriptional regulator [Tumebacillus sp. BK434]|uniref:helix-turn-helix transcriptional regulator n=1 Tax=Tumebacillus sp. BK434 TaxID=2512169 RepID=UPI0010486C01|nr:metalloregulator ArsR/SmtB family transcription factor [Tumebacillus sp. BK434]TCP54692.1 putative ArsR family transcriptional regulator [Tumebacillus sp. BK434]